MSAQPCGCDPEANYPCERYPFCRRWEVHAYFVYFDAFPEIVPVGVSFRKRHLCPYCDDAGRAGGCPACGKEKQ